jgi:hypothetical protein
VAAPLVEEVWRRNEGVMTCRHLVTCDNAYQQGFISVMRHAIALNGSFFKTQRMMQQYVVKAYFL